MDNTTQNAITAPGPKRIPIQPYLHFCAPLSLVFKHWYKQVLLPYFCFFVA